MKKETEFTKPGFYNFRIRYETPDKSITVDYLCVFCSSLKYIMQWKKDYTRELVVREKATEIVITVIGKDFDCDE